MDAWFTTLQVSDQSLYRSWPSSWIQLSLYKYMFDQDLNEVPQEATAGNVSKTRNGVIFTSPCTAQPILISLAAGVGLFPGQDHWLGRAPQFRKWGRVSTKHPWDKRSKASRHATAMPPPCHRTMVQPSVTEQASHPVNMINTLHC